ncbi:MAG: ATP-binding protein [Parvibaculales bacterium]
MLTANETNILDLLGVQSQDGLIVLDEIGVVEFANPAAQSYLGARIVGRRLQNFVRHPDFLPYLTRVTQDNQSFSLTHKISASIQREYDIHLSPFCLKRKKKLVTVKDKTPAQLLEDMRSDFVANVSHELRSPLTNLIGFIETLREGFNETEIDKDMQTHFLGIMGEEAARMNRLINDLLSLSQQVADSHLLPDGEIDYLALIQDACSSMAAKATENGMHIIVAPEGEAAEEANQKLIGMGAYDDVRAALVNLLDNAIKYGHKNTPIEVLWGVIDDKIQISVVNQGDGIDPLHIPRLTERFFRVDKDRARQTGGTGLGLAIVKHIVQRHRGQLRIKSVLNGKTSFILSLPRRVNS